ncbi:MAG: thiamine phosphate synthase [Candidatus Eisenbacteria bacterium]
MSEIRLPLPLLFIGSRAVSGEERFLDALDGALRGGAAAFLLREKDLGGAPLLRWAAEARRRTRHAGALLLVSDRIDVAIAADADGVHLPERSFSPEEARGLLPPGRIVGKSVHDREGAIEAERGGADYLLLGPLFRTPGKEHRALGPAKAAAIREGLSIPVIAVGGVDSSNAGEAAAAGFDGVASIRAIASAKDPEEGARGILAAFEGARR